MVGTCYKYVVPNNYRLIHVFSFTDAELKLLSFFSSVVNTAKLHECIVFSSRKFILERFPP